jgi:5-formyltetrahydrofolate cyclo-ligase
MTALEARGHGLCLPVVVGRGRALAFRRWRTGEALIEGAYGAQVPANGAEVCTPTVLLVPLLAFDRAGYRLGYGGGFYDRTLAGLRAQAPVLAVGLAYAGQEMPAVPREATDQPLDWLVTEAWAAKAA